MPLKYLETLMSYFIQIFHQGMQNKYKLTIYTNITEVCFSIHLVILLLRQGTANYIFSATHVPTHVQFHEPVLTQ